MMTNSRIYMSATTAAIVLSVWLAPAGCSGSAAAGDSDSGGDNLDGALATDGASSGSSSGSSSGGSACCSTSLYAEQTGPADVQMGGSMLLPGVRVDFTVAKDAVVDLSATGSVWWDSGRCTMTFIVDGQPSPTVDAQNGCPPGANRCIGSQEYYPYSAVRRLTGLSPGAHRVEVQLGAPTGLCHVMTQPDAPPTRLYVTIAGATK